MYFQANDGISGLELWRTDGTTAGTTLFKDINVGATGSAPFNFGIVNDKLVFRATGDAATGAEVWVSDGTAAGTVLLKDINLTAATGSTMSAPTLFKGKLYFTATDSAGAEVWTSDGTATGTTRLKDVNLGRGGSAPTFYTVAGNNMYFRAFDSLSGTEIWKTDGTEAGTVLLRDIVPGAGTTLSSNPTQFRAFGNKLVFTAIGTEGSEPWITDGTTAGTTIIKDINSGATNSTPTNYIEYNNKIYFRAADATNGTELWETDGTAANTKMVKNINATGNAAPANFATYGKKLYFQATDGVNGAELWESDGTETGTKTTCEIIAGATGGTPALLDAMLGGIYFSAANDTSGTELFVYKTALGVGTKDFKNVGFSLKAYPTVASETVNIEILSDNNNAANLQLTNLLGQSFLTKKCNLTQGNNTEAINVSALPNGLYFLTLAIGDERAVVKIVKR
jgi:ELWxxDGT repeat protein